MEGITGSERAPVTDGHVSFNTGEPRPWWRRKWPIGPHLGLPGVVSGWIWWRKARQRSWLAKGSNDVVARGIGDGEALGNDGGGAVLCFGTTGEAKGARRSK